MRNTSILIIELEVFVELDVVLLNKFCSTKLITVEYSKNGTGVFVCPVFAYHISYW